MRAGLVLSGGGARCFAQLGALAAFDESGVEVAAIAANSTAAVLAALYAAGRTPAEIREIITDFDFASLVKFPGRAGLLKSDGIAGLLRKHVPETFEELRIPLAVPTVDIQSARQLVFTSGPLIDPVCASNAFPGLFEPIEIDGHFLLDGGILNNLPVDLIRSLHPGQVAVVDTRVPATQHLDLESNEESFWTRLRSAFTPGTPLMVEILMKAYTITQTRLIEIMLAAHPPDLTIVPPLGEDFALQDFGRIDEAYDLGFREAHAQLQRAGW